MRKDKVCDIIAVLTKIRNAFKVGTLRYVKEMRRKAVEDIANSELRAGRFTNLTSAVNTITDAFARRLKPDLYGVEQFDHFVEEWLRTGSTALKNILLRHAATPQVERDVNVFFAEGVANG